MDEEKREFKICHKCKTLIFTKRDHYVKISTFNRSKSPDDHVFFHFNCWQQYFQQAIMENTKHQVEFMRERALSLFKNPAIRSMLGQIQGSQLAMEMLNHPIKKAEDRCELYGIKDEELKSIIKKNIQNERKKRSAKRKNKV